MMEKLSPWSKFKAFRFRSHKSVYRIPIKIRLKMKGGSND